MLNLLQLAFAFASFFLILLGVIVNWGDKYVPSLILKAYTYGKFSYKDSVPFTIQVPKRWFRHFYVVSSILVFTAFIILFVLYFKILPDVPEVIKAPLRLFQTESSTVPACRSLLAMGLLMIHCFKRFYETHFVSVFSDAKMDISHYLLGHFHYIGCVLAIFCEAPATISDEKYTFSYLDVRLVHIIAAALFLWSSKSQFDCANILANLRKNKKGNIVNNQHHIPSGGYFELVSSPHLFFEVIIYISLWPILWENTTWPFIVLWVVANQVETSFLTHWWYKKTFKNYPKTRKSIIPYLL